jgi:hypothetical protein
LIREFSAAKWLKIREGVSMPQRFKLTDRTALIAAVAAAYPAVGYSAPAAQVDFAVGDVTAVGANGQSRTLGKGAQIEQGDTVNTNGGRAQLRFTDGAYVSLQPQTQFRIDQYRYEGKSDGNEKGLFSLLKGGLRTITGLVGRSNKRNYQVSTSVATIGIRGTEYTIQYGQSVTGTVGEGEINVCNGAGCLSVVNGESYYVQNQEFKPVLTNKRTDLPPPAPPTPPTHFAESENVNSDGDPCVLVPCASEPPPPPLPPPLLTGTFSANIGVAHTEFTGNASHGAIVYSGSATFDNGKLVSMTDNGGAGTVAPGTTSLVEGGGDQFISWGRLINGTLGGTAVSTGDHAGNLFSGNESFHFIVGLPTVTLPTMASVTYTLLGATAPTFSSGSGLVGLGSLETLTLLANLSSGRSTGSFSMSLKDPTLNLISFNGTFSGGAVFSGSGTGTGTICSGSCSVAMNGFFAGANAERAGVSYQVQTPGCSTGCTGVGVAALKR